MLRFTNNVIGRAGFDDLAVVENWDGETSLAQVVQTNNDQVSLQVFTGGKGLSTEATVRFPDVGEKVLLLAWAPLEKITR